ncbi:hypothetical protein BTO30_13430 [Domibacillus antri]|uniref:Major virion structural protein n=1 Tax=Domibacillus antri TaxID=1714264 RepID=A0A1Q8Q2Y4_9BACI|nr:hypothetical protein [Domibacillus antri]OLN21699.1 hypothetical protein BTO30_13430 [Domibacillus antri]
MWINEQMILQRFPATLKTIFESGGWEEFAKYRAKDGQKSAEVRLFRATGSDKVKRQFGLINAYDLAVPTFPDNRFISDTSKLAIIGIGNGTQTAFEFPAEYILPGSEVVTVNDTPVANTDYTIDPKGRTITFSVAPNGLIKASYHLSSKAFEPTNAMGVFLFDSVSFDLTETGISIGTGDGTTTIFNIGQTGIKPGSVTVYIDGVAADDLSYVVDNTAGTVTFYTAPASGAITADYAYSKTPVEGYDYGDIDVSVAGLPDTADGMGNLAFAAATYLRPSIPTVFTFTNEENFNLSFGRDSLMSIWGSINKDRIAIFMRADATSDPDNVWVVPFYLGRVNNSGKKPRQNTVLIGGSRAGVTGTWFAEKMLGGTSVDYGPDTTNGNDFVNLHQAVGGAYYQKHYLSFITHSREIEKPEVGNGPSIYTDKYHQSFMSIVHPFDKEIGVLDGIYAVHPKGLEQGDELEVTKTVVHQVIGVGDGETKMFHLFHQCQELNPMIYFDCVEQTGFTYDPAYKAVEFAIAPAAGIEVTASYTVKELYQYNLAMTPVTPMRREEASPYAPIGWGVFKESL